jgi:hypothetical protein
MKLTFQILLLAILQMAFLVVDAAEKHALIIAIGNYDKATSGLSPISSANDVPLIMQALKSQGFDEKNTIIVLDEAATKSGIVQGLAQLEASVNKGDIVVIHYSGHGQQITDDNGDEVDGLDEAIVPYDARARFVPGVYEGENHLRDDDIGIWLTRIRKKVGASGSVLLIMDSCHSGTASRGTAQARGTQEVFTTGTPVEGDAKIESGQFGLDGGEEQKGLASLVCIYGASAHELNYETKDKNGKGVGSLSLAFSEVFANAPSTLSYDELFDQVKIKMSVSAPRQTPQAEGNLDNMLLGGKIEGRKPYFMVIDIWEGNGVTIDGGSLMGVYEGSEVAFYPMGVEPSPETELARGAITFADATTADVQLKNGSNRDGLTGAKAYITQVNYGKMQVSVQLALQDAGLKSAVTAEFTKYPLIKVTESNADLVLSDANASRGAGFMLVTNQDYLLYEENNEAADLTAKEITKRVLAFAQANFLRTIAMENDDLALQFEFVPITAKQVGRGRWQEETRLDLASKKDVSGNIGFTEGDFFKIKITNDGFEVAYVTILDFQPDNVINVLVPGQNKQPADYVLKPGETKELPDVFRFGPPFGTEVFKLVATKEPIDFRSILVSRGSTRSSEGTTNPFAELVSGSFKDGTGTRSSETMNVAAGSCNIYTVTFTINPAQP